MIITKIRVEWVVEISFEHFLLATLSRPGAHTKSGLNAFAGHAVRILVFGGYGFCSDPASV